ncbi:uncharacterized protein LOC132198871 [Neocloeon triangulifer]|uniref:uncharacterized protein LOC132198871 n=1 Tax=Neocloeon triangulifer TaxID=2078957 RepID=UPI00286FA055|nr:uncharacterized protein LOC132198871 [Neocloeon triangulifer]
MWSNRTLAKVATYGAVITVSAAFYIKSKIEDRLKSQPYFKTALRQLEEHPGAVKFLGKPIKMGKMYLEDSENNFCHEGKAQFQVNVRGTKSNGTYFFWSEFNEENKLWTVNRAELELADQPDKRLVIK